MKNEELIERIGTGLMAFGAALCGLTDSKDVEAKARGIIEEQPTKTADAQKLAEDTAEKIKAEAEPETKTKEKPKRKRRTKAELEAEKKAAASEEPAETQTPAPDGDDFGVDEVEVVEANSGPVIDEDALKKALVAYAKANGKEKAFGVLGKYGAKKVADLDPKVYGEVYEQVAVNA